MATWKALLESEQSAELWISRVAAAYQQEKDEFTYRELGDMWGVDKQGAWVKLDTWIRDYPDLVRIEKDSIPHRVCLTFSEADAWLGAIEIAEYEDSVEMPVAESEHLEPEELAESEPTIDYPLFVGQRAYEQTMDRLDGMGILEESNIVEFERLGWDAKNQRGGLTITIFDRKLPVLVAVGRYDNGFLITPLRVSTPKIG